MTQLGCPGLWNTRCLEPRAFDGLWARFLLIDIGLKNLTACLQPASDRLAAVRDRTTGYQCPAGSVAIYRMSSEQAAKMQCKYGSSVRPWCATRLRCTHNKERRIPRWEHEDKLDGVQERLDGEPEAMRA